MDKKIEKNVQKRSKMAKKLEKIWYKIKILRLMKREKLKVFTDKQIQKS